MLLYIIFGCTIFLIFLIYIFRNRNKKENFFQDFFQDFNQTEGDIISQNKIKTDLFKTLYGKLDDSSGILKNTKTYLDNQKIPESISQSEKISDNINTALSCSDPQYLNIINDVVNCNDCPAGAYCIDGKKKLCPNGKYGQSSNTSDPNTCKDCDPGTYNNIEGSSSCIKCDKGTYSGTGAGSCTSCNPGTYSGTGANSCITCDKGTYSGTGASSCTQCEPGSFQDKPGSSSCNKCQPGSYQHRSGSYSLCRGCGGGTYQPNSGGTTCIPCNLGSYSLSFESECHLCPVGTYGVKDLNARCLDCGAGTYTSVEGSTVCAKCPLGTYKTNSSNLPCTGCDPGTYTSSEGSTVCKNCPAGSYTPNIGSKFCPQCDPGSYSSTEGSTICTKCPAGTYNSNYGSTDATSCLKCPTGTYSSAGSNSCLPCLIGKYNDVEGAENCKNCPDGSSNNSERQTSSTSCIKCNSGYYSNNGMQCTICSPGTFSTSQGSSSCINAPNGYYTPGGSLQPIIATAGSSKGYTVNAWTPNSGSTSILPLSNCPAGYACGSGKQDMCKFHNSNFSYSGKFNKDLPDYMFKQRQWSPTGSASCKSVYPDCPPGKRCLQIDGTLTMYGNTDLEGVAKDCPDNQPPNQFYWSSGGLSMCQSDISVIPKGFYLDTTPNQQNHSPSACPKGNYCFYGRKYPCTNTDNIGYGHITQAEYNAVCPQGINTPTV